MSVAATPASAWLLISHQTSAPARVPRSSAARPDRGVSGPRHRAAVIRAPGRAKRWEADQLAKLDAGSWIDPARGRMTFAALADEWQASRGHLAVRGQETTRFLVDKYVIAEIGRTRFRDLGGRRRTGHVRSDRPRLATATRRRALSMMRLVFDYAIRDRRLSVNPARMVALPRGGTKREPHWLPPEQLGRLVMAVPPLCQPVVLFLGTTGCRLSEMAALRVDDVVQTPHGLGVRVHRAATQSKRPSGAVFGADEDAPDADRAGAGGAR